MVFSLCYWPKGHSIPLGAHAQPKLPGICGTNRNYRKPQRLSYRLARRLLHYRLRMRELASPHEPGQRRGPFQPQQGPADRRGQRSGPGPSGSPPTRDALLRNDEEPTRRAGTPASIPSRRAGNGHSPVFFCYSKMQHVLQYLSLYRGIYAHTCGSRLPRPYQCVLPHQQTGQKKPLSTRSFRKIK